MYVAPIDRRTLESQGAERAYWVAPAAGPAPLLVGLHGSGQDGPRLAASTGLDVRGPEAGFMTVFPDAVDRMWDDTGLGRRDGLDDAAFLAELVAEFSGGPAFLVGLSNGAHFAELLARSRLVPVSGIGLVAGTAREVSRARQPQPVEAAPVLLIAGTRDPLVPYGGGSPRGFMGSLAKRGRARVLLAPAADATGVETLAAEWAARNGGRDEPQRERVSEADGDVAVERLEWLSSPPVLVYRLEGGGHGWPGGPPSGPRFLIGRIARRFDATANVLRFAQEVT